MCNLPRPPPPLPARSRGPRGAKSPGPRRGSPGEMGAPGRVLLWLQLCGKGWVEGGDATHLEAKGPRGAGGESLRGCETRPGLQIPPRSAPAGRCGRRGARARPTPGPRLPSGACPPSTWAPPRSPPEAPPPAYVLPAPRAPRTLPVAPRPARVLGAGPQPPGTLETAAPSLFPSLKPLAAPSGRSSSSEPVWTGLAPPPPAPSTWQRPLLPHSPPSLGRRHPCLARSLAPARGELGAG